jgi:hypothetical protein
MRTGWLEIGGEWASNVNFGSEEIYGTDFDAKQTTAYLQADQHHSSKSSVCSLAVNSPPWILLVQASGLSLMQTDHDVRFACPEREKVELAIQVACVI